MPGEGEYVAFGLVQESRAHRRSVHLSIPIEGYAQSTASISGVVKDIAGSVLPGVTVVIKNDTSGASQEVATDAEGRYQATALGAGSYTVTATLAGFKTATAKSIRVAPGQPVSIPLTLEIGQSKRRSW